ncbi:hypothetical protein Tco_0930195 [Tanacetum coccineum]
MVNRLNHPATGFKATLRHLPLHDDMTSLLDDLSYIPPNNEHNEPTQGDIEFYADVVIPGPKSPGKDIDVYLRPLIEDLQVLWDKKGVETTDIVFRQNFNMRAMNEETPSIGVKNKIAYVGHRRFLRKPHKWRSSREFNGDTDHRDPPKEYPRDGTFKNTWPDNIANTNIELSSLFKQLSASATLMEETSLKAFVKYRWLMLHEHSGRCGEIPSRPPPTSFELQRVCLHQPRGSIGSETPRLEPYNLGSESSRANPMSTRYELGEIHQLLGNAPCQTSSEPKQIAERSKSTGINAHGSRSNPFSLDILMKQGCRFHDELDEERQQFAGGIARYIQVGVPPSGVALFPSDMSLGKILPPGYYRGTPIPVIQKIRGAPLFAGLSLGETFCHRAYPNHFSPRRHFAGDMFPPSDMSRRKVGKVARGKPSNVQLFVHNE